MDDTREPEFWEVPLDKPKRVGRRSLIPARIDDRHIRMLKTLAKRRGWTVQHTVDTLILPVIERLVAESVPDEELKK